MARPPRKNNKQHPDTDHDAKEEKVSEKEKVSDTFFSIRPDIDMNADIDGSAAGHAWAGGPSRADEVGKLLSQFGQIEAQFAAVREGLAHSHRLSTLGTLATMIAHEYNNILTPVISYSQMALARPEDQALMKKAVEKALQGALRAAKISRSILGFAREDDTAQIAQLRVAIDDALGCLVSEPEKDGMTLEVDVPDVRVAMAGLSLQQVVLNIVLNARKAMRRQGGTLFIRGHVDGNWLILQIQDTGPGIPPAMLDRLFEPFATHAIDPLDASSDAAPKGTGLGLCICRDLVQQAGGRIHATSTPGHGATFHITLPLAQHSTTTTPAPHA